MLKRSKILIALLAVFSIFIVVNSSQKADAAYGRKGLYTVPKVYRGTWYTSDTNQNFNKLKKVKITTHTLNKKKIYRQDPNFNKKTINKSQKYKRKADKATKN